MHLFEAYVLSCSLHSLFVEVLTAAGVNHLLHDLLVCLVLECAGVTLLLLSLLVRCPVDSLVALEERADLLINLLLFRFAPIGRPSVALLVLGSVSRRSGDITSCGCALAQRVSPGSELRQQRMLGLNLTIPSRHARLSRASRRHQPSSA